MGAQYIQFRCKRAVIELNEKKIRSLRFDKLNGETPLRRLTMLQRRRSIRNLALLIASILVFCAEMLLLLYIGQLYGDIEDVLLIVLVTLSLMALIYLPVLIWLIILVFCPDKCYGMRRLRRLGTQERLVGELEEDLAAEGGVLFQKGSLCVTNRFIIEANLFSFRVYPLEGLRQFDCQKILSLPAFYYENGTIIKMVTRVPFHVLRPYIRPEIKVNMGIEKPESVVNMRTEKPKIWKRDIIVAALYIFAAGAIFKLLESTLGTRFVALCCCGALMLFLVAVFVSEMLKPKNTSNKKKDVFEGFVMFFCPAAVLFYLLYTYKLSVWGNYAAALYGLGVLIWLLWISVIGLAKDKRIKRALSEMKDPCERIRKMEELCAEGFFKNRVLYLNELSAVYYDKQDFIKALELNREACRIQSGERDYQVNPGMTVSEMLRLNEITYLVALERFDEAESLLAPLNDDKCKNPVSLNLINTARAQIAIWKGDAKVARGCLRRVAGLSYKALTEERRVNISCHLLLLEAECDLIERDPVSALAKLDDVLARSTWPANIKRAAELKETIRRKKSGLRRRRHGSHASRRTVDLRGRISRK